MSNSEADLIMETEIVSIKSGVEQGASCPNETIIQAKVLKIKKGSWPGEYFYFSIHYSDLGKGFVEGGKKELRAIIQPGDGSPCYFVKDKDIKEAEFYESDCFSWHTR